MKLEIPDDDLPRLVRALEHFYAYTVARQSSDSRYQELAIMLQRKEPARESATHRPAKKRLRRG
jgi:hypothetical protein